MSLSKDRKLRRIEEPVATQAVESQAWVGVARGVMIVIVKDAGPFVDFAGNPARKPILATSVVPIRETDQGREAVLMFEDCDPLRPIILGLVQDTTLTAKPTTLQVDGETLELTAQRQVVLRCGEASITLTRSGKVLIRGKYILSRSSGVNMIKGGVIHLN
jgi:hypothetical protein